MGGDGPGRGGVVGGLGVNEVGEPVVHKPFQSPGASENATLPKKRAIRSHDPVTDDR